MTYDEIKRKAIFGTWQEVISLFSLYGNDSNACDVIEKGISCTTLGDKGARVHVKDYENKLWVLNQFQSKRGYFHNLYYPLTQRMNADKAALEERFDRLEALVKGLKKPETPKQDITAEMRQNMEDLTAHVKQLEAELNAAKEQLALQQNVVKEAAKQPDAESAQQPNLETETKVPSAPPQKAAKQTSHQKTPHKQRPFSVIRRNGHRHHR